MPPSWTARQDAAQLEWDAETTIAVQVGKTAAREVHRLTRIQFECHWSLSANELGPSCLARPKLSGNNEKQAQTKGNKLGRQKWAAES